MSPMKTTAIAIGILFTAGIAGEAYARSLPDNNLILVAKRGGGGGGKHAHRGGGGKHAHARHGHRGHGHHGHRHGHHGHWGWGAGAVGAGVLLGAPYLYNNTPATYICGYDEYGNPVYCYQ